MSDDNTQGGSEPSPASAGSQLRDQIAALVHDAMRFDREAKTPTWQGGNSYAESRARQAAWQIATLLQPTLTDAERAAVERSERWARLEGYDSDAATLRGLLSRTGTNTTKTDESATESSDQAGKCPERECLTDEEREFLRALRDAYQEMANQTGSVNAAVQADSRKNAAIIRGLLERTK